MLRDDKPVSRDECYRAIMPLYAAFRQKHPSVSFVDLMQKRWGVTETRLMTINQLLSLISYLNASLEGKSHER